MAQYKDVILRAGTEYIGTIKAFFPANNPNNPNKKTTFVVVVDGPKENQFDSGKREIPSDSLIITALLHDMPKTAQAPYQTYALVDGFSVTNGSQVTIKLTKDVVNKIPTELIIEDQNQVPQTPQPIEPSTTTTATNPAEIKPWLVRFWDDRKNWLPLTIIGIVAGGIIAYTNKTSILKGVIFGGLAGILATWILLSLLTEQKTLAPVITGPTNIPIS